MELILDEQQALLADTAARLCRSVGGAARARAVRDGHEPHDAKAWAEVIAAGWLGMTASESHGGLGLGLFDAALAVEEAGKRLLMTPLIESMVVAWTLSRAAGSNAAPAALANMIGGYWMIVPATEPTQWQMGGPRVGFGLAFDNHAMSLNGSLASVPFATHANGFLVATNAGGHPVLAIVDWASEGLSLTTQTCVDGSAVSTLRFDNVAVASETIVARGADALQLASQMQEALALLTAVELLGLATEAHDMTMSYLKLRQQFGRPIGSFQALQHRAVNGFVDVELNRSLVYRVLAEFDRGQHHPAMISAVKARASRIASEVARMALQLHGAVGYTDSHDIGLYYKRAITLAARYGGDLVHTSRFSQLTQ